MHGRMKTLIASLQAIALNPDYSGQTNYNGPNTGPRNENTEYGCAFGLSRAPSIVRL